MNYPNIDPVAISLGPIAIHWYGVMYLVAFVVGGVLGLYRAKRSDGH
ncbi:MAG: prolipoprotein diacylglyceryl transferase, partial [Gammaproteobacteria bacterium]|nr:prolipoprotein diacylglyceryl transferase [Gammaproteobacteria bacterium]